MQAVLTAARVPKPIAKKVAYSSVAKKIDKAGRATRPVQKASEYSKKLSEHLRKERAKATKKNGQLKKGQSQAKIMAAAHKCVRRDMRRSKK